MNVSDSLDSSCECDVGGREEATEGEGRRGCSLYSPCTARSCSSVVQREFILGAGWEREGERLEREGGRGGERWRERGQSDSVGAKSRLRLISVPHGVK